MKTLESLKKERDNLKLQFEKEYFKTSIEYKLAVKRWKNVNSQIRNYNNTTNVMKREGLKVSKVCGGYKVEFKGIEAIVFSDGCETLFWSIDVVKGDLAFYSSQYQTKKDAIWSLYQEIKEAV